MTMKKVWAVLRTASWILFALAAAWGVSLLRLSGEAGTVMSSGPLMLDIAGAGAGAAVLTMGLFTEFFLKAERRKLAREYSQTLASAEKAANLGIIDDIVAPAELRAVISSALSMMEGKRVTNLPKKHTNFPY